MRITCPECGFSRDVPDDKVPAATAVATCPKCRHRFRFRHFEDGYDPSFAATESPLSGSRFSGEPQDGHRPRSGYEASPRLPGAPRRGREIEADAPYAPRPAGEADPGRSPEMAPPRRQERVFPPPSAHWEPAASPEEDQAPSGPDAGHDMKPHPAAMVPPPPPAHDEERLRVDVRAVDAPRQAPAQDRDPEQDQNGVRDIWARLQAMDDEDAPRPAPPVRRTPVSRPDMPPSPPPSLDDMPHASGRDADGGAAQDLRAASGEVSGAFPDADSAVATPQQADADAYSGRPVQASPQVSPQSSDESGERPARAWTRDAEPDGRPSDADAEPSGRHGPSAGDEPDEAPWRAPADGRPGEPARGEVPWERPDAYGFFPGLVLTLKRILFQPVDFFESMPPGRGKGKAMVFNLLLSEFLLLLDFLWALVGVRAKIADTGQTDALAAMAGVPGLGFLALLVMVPLFMAAGIYLDAGLTHLLLMLLRGTSKKFDETFRVMCYSAAPTVLSAVPVAGQLLSPVILIWYMTLQAIGLKKVHGAAYSQALAVVLIKWSLYLFVLLGMLHHLSSGG
jgi:predicted Zn finger-like uncharacterized protein